MVRNNSKIKAEIIAEFHGLTIYGKLQAAKRNGRDRLLIQIRQNDGKVYRIAESLTYIRSADIQFEAPAPLPRPVS
jgi:hypothetical protein